MPEVLTIDWKKCSTCGREKHYSRKRGAEDDRGLNARFTPHQLRVVRADALRGHGHFEREVRAAGEVQHYANERLIQGCSEVPEAIDPRAVPQRLAQRRPECQPDVLVRVVVVNVGVALQCSNGGGS